MTTMISERLAAAAGPAIQVVTGVTDDQFGASTPCAEYAVRDLINHLMHVVVQFQAAAAKQPIDFTTTPDYLADPQWRPRFATETDRLVEAWAVPGADEGVTGRLNLPAVTLGKMALLDLTVHPWDLSRATGRAFTPDPAAVEVLVPMVDAQAPMAREYKAFGEPVPPPEGATAFHRLLCTTGRDPHWQPDDPTNASTRGGSA